MTAGASISCPACGYALTGLTGGTCPECGAACDPVTRAGIETMARRRRRRWLVSALVLLPLVYLPYSWLVFTEYPWSSYRWSWIRSWPVLPGLFPAHMLFNRFSTAVEFVAMGGFTAAMLAVTLWMGSRGRWWLAATAVVVAILSIANGIVSYHVFRA